MFIYYCEDVLSSASVQAVREALYVPVVAEATFNMFLLPDGFFKILLYICYLLVCDSVAGLYVFLPTF